MRLFTRFAHQKKITILWNQRQTIVHLLIWARFTTEGIEWEILFPFLNHSTPSQSREKILKSSRKYHASEREKRRNYSKGRKYKRFSSPPSSDLDDSDSSSDSNINFSRDKRKRRYRHRNSTQVLVRIAPLVQIRVLVTHAMILILQVPHTVEKDIVVM